MDFVKNFYQKKNVSEKITSYKTQKIKLKSKKQNIIEIIEYYKLKNFGIFTHFSYDYQLQKCQSFSHP